MTDKRLIPAASAGSRVHLERALSKLGLLSRGQASTAIEAGEIRVNGRTVTDARFWVDWRKDDIVWAVTRSSGKSHRYGVLHKPKGFLTTFRDELGRAKTVYSLLPEDARSGWIFPVGRLDLDSEGLLLFTNDGPWSEGLTGPLSTIAKTYRVKLDRRPLAADLEKFRGGLLLDGRFTLPCEAEAETGNWVRVVLREGRNRQIRRMFHDLHYAVKKLVRVAIGPLVLTEDFPSGSFRWLTPGEVDRLAGEVGQSAGEVGQSARTNKGSDV